MPDPTDFFPIFVRREEDIREDFNVRANAGLTPNDPAWVDVRTGSQFQLCTQPSVVEHALAYDRMNEVLAAGFLATSWGDYLDTHAASYNEERVGEGYAVGTVTFTGANGTIVGSGVRVGPAQTDPETDPPVFETTAGGLIGGGSVDLPVRAVESGVEGNVGANAITLLRTGVDGVTAITNAAAMSGGADVEADDSLKDRLIRLFSGKGSATLADYAREALRWPGIGYVTVMPHWAGPGTVKLSIRDDSRNPVSAPLVAEFQEHMDPLASPGQGKGWAPINHEVTVVTPVLTPIYVTATVAYKDTFSEATIGQAIIDQVTDYLNSLEPGDDVIFNHVQGQFFKVEGVLNVSALNVDIIDPPAAAVDIVIDTDHIARAGSVTLS